MGFGYMLGLYDSFGDGTATISQKNERIGGLITAESTFETISRLESLVNSIRICDEYGAFVLDTVEAGVKRYLKSVPLGKRKLDNFDRSEAQIVHDCIVAETSNGLSDHWRIPNSAFLQFLNEPLDKNLGRISTDFDRSSTTAIFSQISINRPQFIDYAEIIGTTAHETAHYIENCLAILQEHKPDKVRGNFASAAEYFHSLDRYDAYILPSYNRTLSRSQVNEQIASASKRVAKAAVYEFV
jgi:hypothetical protein